MAFLPGKRDEISTNNSTSTPLGAGGVFTGNWEPVADFAELRMSFDADVAGDDCSVQFSPDASTIERTVSIPPQANSLQTSFGGVHTLNPILPFYRLVYTNGPAPQTAFSCTSTLAVNYGGGLVSRATQTLNSVNDVRLVRTINEPKFDRNLGLVSYEQAKRKFGLNKQVSGGSFQTVWSEGGAYVFPQSAETIRVKAGGDAADTDTTGAGARKIEVSYLDANWMEQSVTINLAGASASAATVVTCIRILKSFVIESGTYGGANTGKITIENTSTNLVLSTIPAGTGRSQDAIYTVPAEKTVYINELLISVGQANSADVRLVSVKNADDITTPFTSVFSSDWDIEDFQGVTTIDMQTFLAFEEKTDICFQAEKVTGGGDARVSVGFEFLLVDNVL